MADTYHITTLYQTGLLRGTRGRSGERWSDPVPSALASVLHIIIPASEWPVNGARPAKRSGRRDPNLPSTFLNLSWRLFPLELELDAGDQQRDEQMSDDGIKTVPASLLQCVPALSALLLMSLQY